MSELERSLTVLADGVPVSGFRHARLTGHDALGLYPMPFVLRLWNLAEADYLLLCSAKKLSVRSGDSVLAAGSVSDVCRRVVPDGRVTEVVFAAGLKLWEAWVSVSVAAGASVSGTVRRILAASGTGIPLLSFPAADPVRSGPQAFFGRAAECVEEALTASGAKGYLTDSGMCVVPAKGLPVSMSLSESDLLDVPVFTGNGLLLVRTPPVGWPLGKTVSVKWKDGSHAGTVLERAIYADNLEGKWESELVIG